MMQNAPADSSVEYGTMILSMAMASCKVLLWLLVNEKELCWLVKAYLFDTEETLSRWPDFEMTFGLGWKFKVSWNWFLKIFSTQP